MFQKLFLKNLNLRLCGHGNLNSYQFLYNQNIFFDWFKKAEKCSSNFVEEDDFYNYRFNDNPNFLELFKLTIKKIIKLKKI